jgi:hypothetical protein
MNMIPAIGKSLRSRWFVVAVHLGLWLLLYLTLTNVGGKAPDLHEADDASGQAQSPVPVARMDALFSPPNPFANLVKTNLLNPFYTRHFIPSQPPTPPPPTTKKIELTYQGFYETEGSKKQTIVKLAETFLITSIGSKVTANLYAAKADMQALTLTNSSAVTNILPLNIKKELEVPIQ